MAFAYGRLVLQGRVHVMPMNHNTELDNVEEPLARHECVAEIVTVLEQVQWQKQQEAGRDALVSSLRQLARRHKRRWWQWGLLHLLFGSFLGFTLWNIHPNALIIFMIVSSSVARFSEWLVNRWTHKKRDIEQAKLLAQYSGPGVVGVLAEVLAIDEVRVQAEEALIRELPKLKASDAHLLTEEQRKYLYQSLKRKNRSLALAILGTLEQIGDEKALPHVESVANGNGAGELIEVRKAAEACLHYLRERAKQHAISQTLLRPSSAAETVSAAPDTLLRPAQYSDTTEPAQLLRAHME